MSLQPALNALAETLVNTALKADPTSEQRLRAVQGKSFRLRIKELPWPITLAFSAQDVMFLGEDYEPVHGEVEAGLAALTNLKDAAEVTRAIQHGDITLHGDPIFAQQASQVVLGLRIDWEEALADRFGDVAGFWIAQSIGEMQHRLPNIANWRNWFGDALIEEKKLLLGQVEFALFSDDLKALEKRVARLEHHLSDNSTNKKDL